MADIAEALIRNYILAKREQPDLRKGQYMQRAFPNRYKNEQSAYQAYNQTTKKRRTGKRLAPLAEPKRTGMVRGKEQPFSYEEGLWKTVIHFNYIDQDGNLIEDQEVSFNMSSTEHTNLLAVPYLEDAILPIAEEYLSSLQATSQSFTDAQITYIEVIPINTYRTTAVDIDRLYI